MLDINSSKDDIRQEVYHGNLKELLNVDQKHFTDREFVKELVHGNGYVLRYLDKSLRDDEEIIKIACNVTPQAVNFASERIITDRTCWDLILGGNTDENETYGNEMIFNNLSERKKDIDKKNKQRDLIRKFNQKIQEKEEEIKQQKERINGEKIEKKEQEEKSDFIKEGVMREVQEEGLKLREYKDYQADPEVVILACKNDERALEFANSELKSNRSFLINLINETDSIEIMDDIPQEKIDEILRFMKSQIEKGTKIIKHFKDDIPRKEMAGQIPTNESEIQRKVKKINEAFAEMEERDTVYREMDKVNLPIPYEEQKKSFFDKIKSIFENIKRKMQRTTKDYEVDNEGQKDNNKFEQRANEQLAKNTVNRKEQFRNRNIVNNVSQVKSPSDKKIDNEGAVYKAPEDDKGNR